MVEELVISNKVAGVYLDQIGSAIPKNCWDTSHHHTLGGGSYWRQGYLQMMNKVYAAIGRTKVPLVTEDNSEVVIDIVSGLLTLNAYRSHFSFSSQYSTILQDNDFQIIAPAYAVVYGGYYVGFGMEWFVPDFTDYNFWRAKLAISFVSGSQLGWFSLLGIASDPEDECGPMGVGDLLLNKENTELVVFLNTLSSARAIPSVLNFLLQGHMTRPPLLNPLPITIQQTAGSKSPDRPILWFDTVLSSSWVSSDEKKVMIFLVGVTTDSFKTSLMVSFETMGFPVGSTVIASAITTQGTIQYISTFKSSGTIDVIVPGSDVLILLFDVL